MTGAAYHVGRRAVNLLNLAFAPGYTLYEAGVAYDTEFNDVQMTFPLNAQT